MSLGNDDLVNENFMENAVAQAQEDAKADEILESAGIADPLESDIEVPGSTFFDTPNRNAEQEADAEDTPSGSIFEDEKPAGLTPQESAEWAVQKYKADGEEFEIDFSKEDDRAKALRAMSREKGSARAFSKLNKATKDLEKFKTMAEENSKYRKVWNKLEGMRDDPEALFEIVSGTKFQDYMKTAVERENKYQGATDEQRQVMDAQLRMQQIERNEKRREAEHKRQQESFTQREKSNRLEALENQYNPIFSKFASALDDVGQTPEMTNVLKESLWTSSISKLQALDKKGYDVRNPKVVEQVFKSRVRAMVGTSKAAAAQEVSNLIDEKKKTAQEQAQIASVRNNPSRNLDMEKLSKKNPVDLLRHVFG
jgi:hypothetical protein